jgi:CSLREA domain-containing protein
VEGVLHEYVHAVGGAETKMKYPRSILIGILIAVCLVFGSGSQERVTFAATFVVDSTGDGADSNTADGVCDDGSGACTLRAAIQQANASTGADTINFSIGGGGVQTIVPLSDLPFITSTVAIDASTQPGFSGMPLIELDGGDDLATALGTALSINAGSTLVRGLVINGFTQAIQLTGFGGSTIKGNFIGTDVTGTVGLPNFVGGIVVIDSVDNVIGGTAGSDRNLISGNKALGNTIAVDICSCLSAASGNQILGNYIGTDISGLADLGNDAGIRLIDASANVIGSEAPGARNLISGNDGLGIEILSLNTTALNNQVLGNYIGTNVTGNTALPNQNGISLQGSNSTIGGSGSGAGNLISANNGAGIEIYGTGNVARGNLIGTTADGSGALGNGGHGLGVSGTSNVIGGTGNGEGNTIAHNGAISIYGSGVYVAGTFSWRNEIRSNRIFANQMLGIDLAGSSAGPEPNDPGDMDLYYANKLQNFPEVTSAVSAGMGNGTSYTRIQVDLNSIANSTYAVELFSNSSCDDSGYGQGESLLHSASISTDSSGNGSMGMIISPQVPVGRFITATATDAEDNTSEFSLCREVMACGDALADADADQLADCVDLCPTERDCDGDSNLPPAYTDCKGPCPGGFNRDYVEAWVGTSLTNRCADTGGISPPPGSIDDEADDKWPPDFNDDRNVNALDFPRWRAYFPDPSPLNSPAAQRSDLNADNNISMLDFAAWKPYFTSTCTP